MADRQFLEQLSRKLADEGKLIEAGWMAMRAAVIPADAPPGQLREMRLAYMAGAQHLFSSIMLVMDPGDEPTAEDERRMELINAEIKQFTRELEERVRLTKGSG